MNLYLLSGIFCVLMHLAGIILCFFVVHKYEEQLKNLKGLCIFNPKNFAAIRLWLASFSIFASLGATLLSIENLSKLIYSPSTAFYYHYILIDFVVSSLMLQYNLYLLMDRRK